VADTTTSSLSYDTTAYNKLAWFSLRHKLYYDDIASVKSTPQTHVGSSVQFNIVADMAAQTTELTEGTDVTAVALSDSTVTVTLREQGAVVNTTAKLHHTGFIPLDPIVASAVGFNAGKSINEISKAVLVAGTNVRYGGNATSRTTIDAADTLDSADARRAFAELVGADSPMLNGGLYRAYVHPDVAYDLKSETGEVGWRTVHNYSLPENIKNGSLGVYEGFLWVVDSQANLRVDASNGTGAAGTVDVYDTLFVGGEALAKAFSTGTHPNGQRLGSDPIVFPGPIVDSLYREVPFGWYHFVGYSIFRQACLRRVEAASSIGQNT